MSKPRFNWWPFALNMIKDYPARKKEHDSLLQQKVTADFSGMPGGGGASRTAESVALRSLPRQEQREYDAVRRAVEYTKTMAEGRTRMKVVKLTLLGGGCTIGGAAMRANVPERTAQRFRWQFVLLVGYTYGFLTKEEYLAETKRDAGN